jgi:SAM-dependent methyltransferase
VFQIFGRNKHSHVRSSSDEPSLERPVSQACTYDQFLSPIYAQWCEELRETPRLHRKQWEFVYILQVLSEKGMLGSGRRGLGFGVGNEPLPAAMAARGCEILATDYDYEQAKAAGWVSTDQHASGAVNDKGICDATTFAERVRFRVVDMNAIPEDLLKFDFTWSSCALEHLGSIANGLRFIKQSLQPLISGGIAVHTTEFNCYSNWQTIDNNGTVLFRRCDIERVASELRAEGHQISLNFELGSSPLDNHVDVAPYSENRHLKLLIGRFASTSFGLIIQKA